MERIEELKAELLAELKKEVKKGNFKRSTSYSKSYAEASCEGVIISISNFKSVIVTFSLSSDDIDEYYQTIRQNEIDELIEERDKIDKKIKELQQ